MKLPRRTELDALIDTVTGTLAGYGVLGAWAMYLIWQSWKKDQIIEKRDERIADLQDKNLDREIEGVRVLTELTILVRAISGGKA